MPNGEKFLAWVTPRKGEGVDGINDLNSLTMFESSLWTWIGSRPRGTTTVAR